MFVIDIFKRPFMKTSVSAFCQALPTSNIHTYCFRVLHDGDVIPLNKFFKCQDPRVVRNDGQTTTHRTSHKEHVLHSDRIIRCHVAVGSPLLSPANHDLYHYVLICVNDTAKEECISIL